MGDDPQAAVVSDDAGILWGTTRGGGLYGCGTIYQLNPATGAITTLIDFTGKTGANLGQAPYSSLVNDGAGYFWGTTSNGGASGYGTVYKIHIASGLLTTVVEFKNNATVRGGTPYAGLTRQGDYMWGTTSSGFTSSTVFKVHVSTGEFTSLAILTSNLSEGFIYSALTDDGTGNLWGVMAPKNYTANAGKIFKINASAGTLTWIYSYPSNTVLSPSNPVGGLTNDGNGNLWGTTCGDSSFNGSIFKIDIATGTVTKVSNLDLSLGGSKTTMVSDGQGWLWGIASGLPGYRLSVFRFNPQTGVIDTQYLGTHPFSLAIYASLYSGTDGKIYGVTPSDSTPFNGANNVMGQVFRLTPDRVTETPLFASPAANTSVGARFNVSFTLPEPAFYGSIKLTFDNGAGIVRNYARPVQSPPSGSSEQPLDYAFELDAKSILFSAGSATVVDSTLPDGLYSVTLSYRDLNGNEQAAVPHANVRIDSTGPGIALPAQNLSFEATSPAGAQISYILTINDPSGVASVSYSAESGSVLPVGSHNITATAVDNLGNQKTFTFYIWVIDTVAPTVTAPANIFVVADETGGAIVDFAATADDIVGVTEITYSIPSGSHFGIGVNIVTIEAKDAAGNIGTASFDVTVTDITPPVMTVALFPMSADSNGTLTLPALFSWVTVSDNSGIYFLTQEPPAGTVLPPGKHLITFTAKDETGNTTVRTGYQTILFASGPDTTAPRTGSTAPLTVGLDPATIITAFQVPAISDRRDLAAKATLKAGRTTLAAIYQQDWTGQAELRAYQGQPVADLAGAKFKSFGDPVLAPQGAIAFAAKLQGAGVVTTATDDAIWTDALGDGLRMVLREGSEVLDGLKLKAVSSFSLRDGEVLALAILQTARGSVTTADDTVVLRLTATGAEILLREGALITAGDRVQPSKVKTISILGPALGSPGHGRWQAIGVTVAKATLADGRTVLLRLAPGEAPTPLLATQTPASELELTAKWTKFGLPALGNEGTGYALHGTLQSLRGEVTSSNETALLYSGDGEHFSELIRENASAFTAGGPVFASFLDPVVNGQGEALFQATLRGSGITAKNKIGLWRGVPGELELAVQLGDTVTNSVGVEMTGYTWKSFLSHALPDGRGPLFLAQFAGPGIKSTNNLGLWAQGWDGKFYELIRTGELIEFSNGSNVSHLQVKTFTLLTSPAGVFGATRSFNATGSVAVLVTFTDKSQAILRLDLP